MLINNVIIDNTFAEAFPMKATRVIITAITAHWAYISAKSMTGFSTSVLGCSCEAGIETLLSPAETPDGRPGVSVMLFTMNSSCLINALNERAKSSVLTVPSSALYSGIEGGNRIPLGESLCYFGDGFQTTRQINGKDFWQIPVLDGEFLVEATTGQVDAIGGGNLLILAESTNAALEACEQAVIDITNVANVILPFPGGIVRSGSKVGSKYSTLRASTNDAFCPTLKGATQTQLSNGIESVLEIVIDGLHHDDIRKAMCAGIKAICSHKISKFIKRISAGNYGGKLGKHHFHLQEIMAETG